MKYFDICKIGAMILSELFAFCIWSPSLFLLFPWSRRFSRRCLPRRDKNVACSQLAPWVCICNMMRTVIISLWLLRSSKVEKTRVRAESKENGARNKVISNYHY